MLPNSDRISALIIDDSEHVRALLSMLLKKEGVTKITRQWTVKPVLPCTRNTGRHSSFSTICSRNFPEWKCWRRSVALTRRQGDHDLRDLDAGGGAGSKSARCKLLFDQAYSSQKLMEVVRRVLGIAETAA